MAEHYHLWLASPKAGVKRAERRAREWAANGGGDFPVALPRRRPQAAKPVTRNAVRQYQTSRLLRFESKQAAQQWRARHRPKAHAMIRKCTFSEDECPSPEPIPIWERRDDR